MIISMQGNWTVAVKSKNAAFDQRFIVSGASTGNGTYTGTVGTSATVTGTQWTIAIQNNPGAGFQLSDTTIKFPHQVGSHYEFEIWSNDAGADKDFDDLILTCSTPASINDFIIFGNVSVYHGRCIFNPCRRGPFVIDTAAGLAAALKNSKLREVIERLYPERVRVPVIPNPPDPPPFFKPIVIDLFGEATQPRTALVFQRTAKTTEATTKKAAATPEFAVSNFSLVKSTQLMAPPQTAATPITSAALANIIDGLVFGCRVEPAANITLSFEEYDRTASELSGGAYTGTGPRRFLGDAITDMNGNYIFRFSFDMTFPFIEDAVDVGPGEDINVVAYPDVIAKVVGFSPYNVLYESAPYYNIPNLKRIDLCLPQSTLQVPSVCFNGSLIGSLGNVFIGGNQNATASFTSAALRRYGYSNFLEENGQITVGNSLALFTAECAAWAGVIDMKGCMYDAAKPAAQNTIKWYTIRITRAGSGRWEFVSQNYKHPRYSKRNLPNYIGDDVGSFPTSLHVDGGAAVAVPAYKNIQREIFVDGVDWEFANFDRYLQLTTSLYDVVAGVTTPGTFYVRVDCYDTAGNPVAAGTDMIALYIHNRPLDFQLVGPSFSDPTIVNSGCGLYRLANDQMNSGVKLSFKANDPEGFVDVYDLTMGRCPSPMLALRVNQPNPPLSDTLAGQTTLAHGDGAGNVHDACPGFTGTIADFSDPGLIDVELQPALSEGGWIRNGEYFTVLSVALSAYKRVTNGYNGGLSGQYYAGASIYMERLTP
jgi:hypothetical protein